MPLNSTLKVVTCILCIYFAIISQQKEVLKMKWLAPIEKDWGTSPFEKLGGKIENHLPEVWNF